MKVFLGKNGGEIKLVMKRKKSSRDVTSRQVLQNITLVLLAKHGSMVTRGPRNQVLV